ncbi:glycosyltransferase involved in cell wall biosynthesis [Leeuwenhoekiella aestuarii]|uniref:glycosyltransferase family 2 protein n=1 Tax=Leeuwenhoekiella aestuarii TaxID=2249426 RepID=UPI000FFF06D6|nr:glycosyltransferase family 2 protein [Leeuwenhoekiella aestuarii]RXG13770.1 glycosyltransferase involved in cell wall biosynthesis [Leeuwenhoekiella aestuarii]
MHEQPLVSIIIPTYNRAHLIGETLDSVLAQTYTHWECIVVDDGSTDGTDEVLAEYVAKDSRFQYHHRPKDRPKGANACRNYGFELSQGEYIQWLDSDDIIKENKLEAQVNLIINQSFYTVLTCKWYRKYDFNGNQLVMKDLKIYRDYYNPIELLEDYGRYSTFYPLHCFLIPRSLIVNSSPWNEYLKINQDGLFFTNIFLNADKILFAPDTGAYYRMHLNEQTSIVNSKEKALDLVRSWKLIKKLITKNYKKKYVKHYINLGKNYSYSSLKEGGFKEVIFLNSLFFRDQLMKDLWKKTRKIIKV